jgi:hypothetical protein
MTNNHAHLGCAVCGYDLHGLPEDGNCPECALPVAKALAGSLFVQADPHWLANARKGIRLFNRGICGLPAGGILLGCLSTIIPRHFLADAPSWARTARAWPGLCLLAMCLLMILVGLLRLTAVENDRRGYEPFASPRRLTRMGAALVLLLLVWHFAQPGLRAPLWVVAVVVLLSLGALLQHLHNIARRIPAQDTADKLRLLPAILLGNAAILCLICLLGPTTSGGLRALLAFLGAVNGLFSLVAIFLGATGLYEFSVAISAAPATPPRKASSQSDEPNANATEDRTA